jgi:hypothetical protein
MYIAGDDAFFVKRPLYMIGNTQYIHINYWSCFIQNVTIEA